MCSCSSGSFLILRVSICTIRRHVRARGAGAYFIKVAFSLLGHMRGGPAKAAVVASGLSGIVSGSSIANVVTTGTFTIPLMKELGFLAQKQAQLKSRLQPTDN